MTQCLNCTNETKNPKFCSRSCAAKYNNKLFPKRKSNHYCKVCNAKIEYKSTICIKCKTTPKYCLNCQNIVDSYLKTFCNEKCSRQYNRNINREHYNNKINTYIKNRRNTRKSQLIELKGGKCEICGYNKNHAALCFHHIDSSKKSFEIGSNNLNNYSLDELIKETNKCKLLCFNCHREIHHPKYKT